MKIISNDTHEGYQEIVVEKSLLFGKYFTTYRRIEDTIFEYRGGDKYLLLSIYESIEVEKYFKLRPQEDY